MAASYPSGLDTMSDPGTNLSGPPTHSSMHNQINDVIEAIEAELGLSPSSTWATVAARLTAIAPAWVDWSTGNGHATNVSGAVGSINGGTNWGSTPTTYGRVLAGVHNVRAKMRITAGGTGVAAGTAGIFRLNLPVNTVFPGGQAAVKLGSGTYINGALTLALSFDVMATAAGTASLDYQDATNALVNVSTTAPHTLASGSILYLDLDYETA